MGLPGHLHKPSPTGDPLEVLAQVVRVEVVRAPLGEHPGTGAVTELVEIVRRDRLVPTTADAALEIGARNPGPEGRPVLLGNARSKRVAVLLPAPSRMFDDGGVQERVRLLRPATRDTMTKAELDASNWREATEAEWRALWDREIGELPTHREPRFWLATGLLLPVSDKIQTRVYPRRSLPGWEEPEAKKVTTIGGQSVCDRGADEGMFA